MLNKWVKLYRYINLLKHIKMKRPEPPTLYKRKYKDDDEVSLRDLQTAYRRAAKMVVERGDQFLPVFDRIDKEIQEHKNREALKARAQKVAQRPRPDPS
jgi:hypothetical protein